GGLDTKTDPASVQPGRFLELINVRFVNPGRLSKRYGINPIPSATTDGGSITVGAALSTVGDELVEFDGAFVYSYLPSVEGWVSRGRAVSVVPSVRQVRRTHTEQQLNPDVAVLSGLEVTAWEDSGGGIRYAVVDST